MNVDRLPLKNALSGRVQVKQTKPYSESINYYYEKRWL